MQNTIKILIDLKKETYRFDQAQQEDDVILDITLLENGVAKDITGETVELIYINANNTVASVTGDKVIVTGNNIKITCPRDCTRSYGIAKFQLKIIGTYQVSTFPIALTIVPGVNQGQPVSQNISTILEQLTAKNIECKETLESLNAWVAAHGDITVLDERVESLASQLEEKANKTYVDLQLGEKTLQIDNLNTSKVDKVVGKGLSTNDYNDSEKSEVAKVKNKADKTELEVERRRIDSFTKLVEGSTTGDAELIDGRIGIDGTTYNNIGGAIRKQVGDISKKIDGYICITKNSNGITTENNKYVDYGSGSFNSSTTNNPSIAYYIPCIPSTEIKLILESVPIAGSRGFSFYDKDKKFISGIPLVVNQLEYNLIIPSNAVYVSITYFGTDFKLLYKDLNIFIDYISTNKMIVDKSIENNTNSIKSINTTVEGFLNISSSSNGITTENNKYVDIDTGSFVSSTTNNPSIAYYIPCIPKSSLKIILQRSLIAGSRGFAFYDKSKKFISSASLTVNQLQYELTIPDGAVYMALTYFGTDFTVTYDGLNATKLIKASTGTIDESIELPQDNIIRDGGFTKIFRTIGVIGDSLSSGEMEYISSEDGKTHYKDMYEYSWIQYMARYCGSTAYNFSEGGMSTRSFLADQGGKYTMMMDGNHKCQAYFIALCHNDYNQRDTLPVGSSADIDVNNCDNNADTFYGNYAKIISKIKQIQKDAKIFIVTDVNNAYREYNTAMRYMETIFDNVYVVDLNQYGEALNDWEYTQGHGNTMGYLYRSYQISSYVDWIIRHKRNEFKYVQFIGTTYPYVNS